MGIPGLLKEIGKGERIALSKLAIEHLERHNRPLRIAIDAAIWNFQSQSGQGGRNPALRTLFFRLLRLLALPIQPVFVYDGRNKPLTKRGRTVTRYGGTCVPNELSKGLVRKFSYPSHVAPGEAEAECALLQKRGIVDVVMSQDVDAIMFGAKVTLRDWSKEGTRGNKAPTHVNLMDSIRLKEVSGLDSDGMILVALLSGGDYDEAGVAGFGSTLACEIARAGFGKDLIDLARKEDWSGLREWRERLQYELETNESGYFRRRHKTLTVPDAFPDLRVLGYYLNPAVSQDSDLLALEASWNETWNSEIDIPSLRDYTATMFDWSWRSGARRFVRCFAQPLFHDRLRRGTVQSDAYCTESISERRQHFVNDGIPELRLSAIPAEVVGIDIEAEEDNPEYAERLAAEEEDEEELARTGVEPDTMEEQMGINLPVPPSPSKKRKSPPWDAYVSEKWWIPETLLSFGLPKVVEDWYQAQRELRAGPKKGAVKRQTKSSKSTGQIDTSMKAGAIRGFFTQVDKQANKTKTQDAFDDKLTSVLDESSKFQGSVASKDVEGAVPAQSKRVRPGSSEPSSRLRDNRICQDQQNETSHHPPIDEEGASQFDINAKVTSKDAFLGSSFSTAITLSSSPAATELLTSSQVHESDGRMDHVTHRRYKRTVPRAPQVPSSPLTSPARVRRPIESFFMQSQEDSVAKSTDWISKPLATPSEAALIPKPCVAVTRSLKSTALARDSLPGTWREADAGNSPARRPPRISYIDLTGD